LTVFEYEFVLTGLNMMIDVRKTL